MNSLLRICGGLLAGCFLFAAWCSVRAAESDFAYQKNTLESLQRAIALAPDNAVYRALLAEQLDGLNQDPKPQLAEVTRLTPLESQYWIRRAFRAEIENQYAEAEGFLKEAARVDRKSSPRWALMNFYFRRNQDTEFWYWVNKALLMGGYDNLSIFRLAWNKSDDNAFIVSHIPDRPEILSQYFYFLTITSRLDQAGTIPLRVAKSASAPYYPALIAYCDRYALRDPPSALQVWNVLCSRKILPFEALDPERSPIITNPDFSTEPSDHGFDWHAKTVDGILVNRDNEHGIRVELSGSQPEDCVLLSQTIPLWPGTKYDITWISSSPDTPIPGFSWEILGQEGPVIVGAVSGIAAPVNGTLRFTATALTGTLQLRYKRPLGFVRASGALALHDLKGQVAK